MDLDIVLLPNSPEVWEQFAGFFKYRNLYVPPRPRDGVWVGLTTGELLGGVCLYPCEDAPYVFAQHIATRPGANPRVLYTAMQLGMRFLQAYSALRGRAIICLPEDKSLGDFLERYGFMPQPSVVYMQPSVALVLGQYRKEPPKAVGEGTPPPAAPARVPEQLKTLKPAARRRA